VTTVVKLLLKFLLSVADVADSTNNNDTTDYQNNEKPNGEASLGRSDRVRRDVWLVLWVENISKLLRIEVPLETTEAIEY